MKLFSWFKENYLLAITLFLLAFIPLYPKFPLLDLKHTWVYIRVEDFIIAAAWIVFFVSWLKKKATLKTPLSWPILIFWIVGLLATINGIIFIFPKLEGVFPNLAILNFLRRVEYLSVFFLAYSAIKDRKAVNPIVITLTLTLLAVFFYGIGQRIFGFPAFLTMNEEFAKGVPLRLSALARVPSTFAGHYDLAAYLILLIPVIGSFIFGYRKWYLKILFFLTATAGLVLLLMTASRVSFAVYMIAIAFMLVLQKQKKFIIPVFILSILLLKSFAGISSRFAQTFTQVDLVVDSRTGKAIGVASGIGPDQQIVIEDKQSTGENLPTGSKYINLQGSGKQVTSEIVYKKLKPGTNEQEIISKTGTVIVKKAFAYDVSFTTRFQGEWPRAIEAFKRNIFLGSGYSSINLATDNSFLRMLGETGLVGFFSFVFIFVFMAIYLFRVAPSIEDSRIRALVYGVLAGTMGLALNAILIDVYEASKVAFVLWLILGVTLGLAHIYQKKEVHYFTELKRIFTSVPALIITLGIVGFLVFSMILSNYFVGDDFTWLRWAADCKQLMVETGLQQCGAIIPTITSFFTNSENFFYRPGTKSYFFLAYPVFELFPMPFHVISVLLHIAASILFFFIARKVLKNSLFGFVAAFLFLMLSVHAEAVYWISVTGHLITTCLLFLSLLSYMYWRETKRSVLFIIAAIAPFIAMFFHEFGTTGPLLLLGYDLLTDWKSARKAPLKKWYYLILLLPIVIYYVMRKLSHSVWFQGDYSYNLVKLPLNVVGNAIGYLAISVVGPVALPYYTVLRTTGAAHLALSAVVLVLVLAGGFLLARRYRQHLQGEFLKIALFSGLLFFIPLLPFLGLGNISPRYAYMGSAGVALFIAYLAKTFIKDERQKRLGYLLVAGILLVFSYIQFSQLQKINKDWHKAGEIANNTIISINYAYSRPGALPKYPIFSFVNLPIKYGDAWVFPVGLQDAIWFPFQNLPTPIKVMTVSSEDEALRQLTTNQSVRVFKYDKDGSLSEVSLPPDYAK